MADLSDIHSDDERRDEQRRREREARERARERSRAKAGERAPAAPAPAPAQAAPEPDSFAPEPVADHELPDFAAPSTRAGRERQAVFAPARPAPDRAGPSAAASAPGASHADSAPAGAARAAAALASAGALLDRLVVAARARPRAAMGIAAAGVVLILGFALTRGGDETTSPRAAAQAKSEERKKARAKSPYGVPTDTPLPPETRVVAYTGAPQADELGILGTMPFEQASGRLDRQAKPYDRKTRPVMRAFDLIATIADADPGPAGKYRTRQTSAVIARYLRAARRHDAMLILDVQPGGSNFVDELRPLARWLKEPDVHLALDPEWRMRPGVRPGSEIGYVSAGEITATLNRVAQIVRANDLPPKLVLVHRFTDGMIKDLPAVQVPKEVVGVISIDGVGSRALKEATYDRIAPNLPKPWLAGFKVFYEEDAEAGGLMYGDDVMALKPRPHVVLYE